MQPKETNVSIVLYVLLCFAVMVPDTCWSIQTGAYRITSSVIIPTGKFSPLLALPIFNRTRSHSTLSTFSKVKMSSLGLKLHNTTYGIVSLANVTRQSELNTQRNFTRKYHHRLNASRLLKILTLTRPTLKSSQDGVQFLSNPSLAAEQVATNHINVTLFDQKNGTVQYDQLNKTISTERKQIRQSSILDQQSNATEEASSIFRKFLRKAPSAKLNITTCNKCLEQCGGKPLPKLGLINFMNLNFNSAIITMNREMGNSTWNGIVASGDNRSSVKNTKHKKISLAQNGRDDFCSTIHDNLNSNLLNNTKLFVDH